LIAIHLETPIPSPESASGGRWRAGFIPSSPRRRLSEPEAAKGGEVSFRMGTSQDLVSMALVTL
jgi:hypothetical protein